MLAKKSLFSAISLEFYTPFDFQLITYSVLFFKYLNVLKFACKIVKNYYHLTILLLPSTKI